MLDDARPVRRRRAVRGRREVQVVDLDGRAVGQVVGVEEAGRTPSDDTSEPGRSARSVASGTPSAPASA